MEWKDIIIQNEVLIKILIGIGLIIGGLFIIKNWKIKRDIPAPNNSSIHETNFNYRKLMIGICCIIGGILLIIT